MPGEHEPGAARSPSSGVVVAGSGLRRHGPLEDAAAWTQGRNGWVRLPLLLWFGYILLMHLRHPDYDSLFGGLNLGIHELGHLVFGFLGSFPGVAGGTILQLLVPLGAIVMFRRQRDYFAVAVAACWLGTNLFSVARYAGDARARLLPLVSPVSGDPIHDWNYMLGRLGLLGQDLAIARGIRLLAVVSMLVGLALGGWLVGRMLRRIPRQDAGHG